jgi:hypothetical protein
MGRTKTVVYIIVSNIRTTAGTPPTEGIPAIAGAPATVGTTATADSTATVGSTATARTSATDGTSANRKTLLIKCVFKSILPPFSRLSIFSKKGQNCKKGRAFLAKNVSCVRCVACVLSLYEAYMKVLQILKVSHNYDPYTSN